MRSFVKAAQEQAAHYASNHIMFTMGSDFNYESALEWYKNLDKLVYHVNKMVRFHFLSPFFLSLSPPPPPPPPPPSSPSSSSLLPLLLPPPPPPSSLLLPLPLSVTIQCRMILGWKGIMLMKEQPSFYLQ